MKKIILLIVISIAATSVIIYSYGPNADKAFKFWNTGQKEKAFPMLLKLAKRGNAKAQFIVSRCYQFGDHIKKDTAQANYWLKKSAENGFPEAQLNMSYKEHGKKGEKEAFKWVKDCADQQYPSCMQALAVHYETGRGVEKNMDAALAAWKRLALLNSVEDVEIFGNSIANARFKLGTDYCEGNFVDKDLVTGYAWYIIYNECKRHLWLDAKRDNIQKIYLIEDQLSPAEKKKALEMAEDILNAPIKQYGDIHAVE
jgi:uncharacterized protein